MPRTKRWAWWEVDTSSKPRPWAVGSCHPFVRIMQTKIDTNLRQKRFDVSTLLGAAVTLIVGYFFIQSNRICPVEIVVDPSSQMMRSTYKGSWGYPFIDGAYYHHGFWRGCLNVARSRPFSGNPLASSLNVLYGLCSVYCAFDLSRTFIQSLPRFRISHIYFLTILVALWLGFGSQYEWNCFWFWAPFANSFGFLSICIWVFMNFHE